MALQFNPKQYTVEEKTVDEITIKYRAFRDIPYVEKPVNPEFQKMHIFVPEAYYEGAVINGYTLETAPVFVPNTVGGYMPGPLDEPGPHMVHETGGNSLFEALKHGYVAVAPAIRGRTQQDADGVYNGKAPACIVDYKAAVRFLHAFADQLPGDEDKIISNGTSAGGALSALLGMTGEHPDYEPYLEAIGAAKGSDAIYGCSCYCPITNLDHADMAYEWQFDGAYDCHRMKKTVEADGTVTRTPTVEPMPGERIAISRELAKQFPPYLNSLQLQDEEGKPLTLDEAGNGSFKEYIAKILLASANRAIDRGADLSDKEWLTIRDGQAVEADYQGWVADLGRMKSAPSFDDVDMTTPENNLFGTETLDNRHFTAYSHAHSTCNGPMAEESLIRMMNPLYYVEDPAAKKPKHWRIRHGEYDPHTSLAISAILTCVLRKAGCQVDYHAPWNKPHAGDYDLDELFAWADEICKEEQ